ncbi:MAG: hypothetical protein RIC36_18295 [Rhodospirillales bacterium]
MLRCLILFAALLTISGPAPATAQPPSPQQLAERARSLIPLVEDEYDFREIVALYTEASRQGLTIAKYELAELLSVGPTEWADYITAARLYREAALAGHRQSRCICGWMHSAGMYGSDVDYARAHALMTLDGRDVCEKMKDAIESVEIKMTAADRARASEISRNWLKGDTASILELQ